MDKLFRLRKKYKALLFDEKSEVKKGKSNNLSMLLCYPNSYKIGMSNLGFLNIYSILNKTDDITCERLFYPDKDEIEIFKGTGRGLLSLESTRDIIDFDIVAFSVTFELDYLNLISILDLSKIPVKRSDRDESYPLIIVGGICTTINPEPIADFVDVFILGDGEGVTLNLIDEFRQEEGRNSFYKSIAKFSGIYVPGGYNVSYLPSKEIKSIENLQGFPKKVIPNFIKDINLHPRVSGIITKNTVFSDTLLIELESGCPMRCYFCAPGNIYKKCRFLDVGTVKKIIKDNLLNCKKVGFLGMAIGSFPDLDELCAFCIKENIPVTVSSLRIDKVNNNLIKLLSKSGYRTITLAPETGLMRLRKSINKRISDNNIFDIVSVALENNILNVKLYFIIGLPDETEEDILAIPVMVKKIKEIMLKKAKAKRKIGQITISVNPFVPKPHTVFQNVPMENLKTLKKRMKLIQKELKGQGNVKIISESFRLSVIQGVLSLGDRNLSELLINVMENGGDWFLALRELGIDPGFYVYRKKNEDEVLPWSHLG